MFLMFIVSVSLIILTYAFRLYDKIRTQDTKKSIERCDPNNDEDLISRLPDSVICHILSGLPSDEAVRTSVLSKDWEHKWTTAYNIDITVLMPFQQRSTEQIFCKFTEKILDLPHDLKSFRLSYRVEYNIERLMKWISAAIRRKVESFELEQVYHDNCVVPISLFNSSTSLRTLKLMCTLKVSRDTIFPHLTDLYLDNATILNEQSNSIRLSISFPVLKTLVMISCKWLNVKLVEIYSPALRTFECRSLDGGASDHLIKIFGAKLENFESSGIFLENIYLEESTVHKATLQSSPWHSFVLYGLQARKLMSGCSNLADLYLSSVGFCEVIEQAKQTFRLPKFDRLLRLQMCLGRNDELIFELLHCAPSLKFLQLDGNSVRFDFAEVDSVPYCVKTHLEEVVFNNNTYKPIRRLAEFFLINGSKLKKVVIEDYYLHRKKVIDRLRKLPKASADVQIFPPGSYLYKFRGI